MGSLDAPISAENGTVPAAGHGKSPLTDGGIRAPPSDSVPEYEASKRRRSSVLPLEVGTRVMCRWRDGKYHPVKVIERRRVHGCGPNDYEYYVHYTECTKNNYCRCGNRMNRSVTLTQFCEGFVKGATTFVITDDLNVLPHSMDHTLLGLIKTLGVKNTSSVKEMNVDVTKEKVLDLLKCSLLSKTPLTDLFLGKKPFIERSRSFSCDVENIFCSDIRITVKLAVRKSDNNILYALGGQDFAKIFINFLSYPLGGFLGMVQGNVGSLGSINGLHKSITNLDEDKYLISKEAKKRLLKLNCLQYYCYYQCDALDDRIIHVQLYKSDEDWSGGGNFRETELVTKDECRVKRPEIYLVTDDLVIEPWLSPISSLCLLTRFKTPLDDLEEKVVTFGVKEIFSILKAALSLTSALTNGLRHLLTEVEEEEEG